ncbi:hypothetical protein ACQU0X_08465 [Pseudovibrio ascidiaceicola]|uniref:hypothetical protein n=1 Tax=Pseudovibrio ascidiaceicola TaxID=285279 RepID=UPI003D36829D
MQPPKCPELDQALIRYLKGVFPDTCADPNKLNPYQAYGRAEVVRHLEAKLETQEEEHVPIEAEET